MHSSPSTLLPASSHRSLYQPSSLDLAGHTLVNLLREFSYLPTGLLNKRKCNGCEVLGGKVRLQLQLMILKDFSNLSNSMIV